MLANFLCDKILDMGEPSMSPEQLKPNVIRPNPEQPPKQMGFDDKIKALFSEKVEGNYRRIATPLELKDVDNFLSSSNRFTDKWWDELYKWMDYKDFHREKNSVAQITFESLDTLPPDTRLPSSVGFWASDVLRYDHGELKGQIEATLENDKIPASLRAQIPSQLTRHPDVWSLDTILKGYGLFGESVGIEMRKNIVPLFMSGLAIEEVFNANRDALVRLYTKPAANTQTENPRPKIDGKRHSILSKISQRLNNLKGNHHPPSPKPVIIPEKKTNQAREQAERRVGAIRDLVRELFPTYQEYYDKKEFNWPTEITRITEDDNIKAAYRLSEYESEILNQHNNAWRVSEDASTLPLDVLERYLSDVRQLRTVPGFGGLATRIMGDEIDRGILPPYVALGASTNSISREEIPFTSILRHLNELDKSGSLDDRILDEILTGIDRNLLSNDALKISGCRNLRILMTHQLPQDMRIIDIASLLTIPEENIFKDVLDTTVLMALENNEGNRLVNRAIFYLTSKNVIDKLHNIVSRQEDIGIFLEVYRALPVIDGLHEEFSRQFTGKETVQFFKDMSASYSSFQDKLVQVVTLVGETKLTKERALELPTKASDVLASPLFSLTINFPNVFLATDADTEFFRTMLVSYQSNAENMRSIANALENNLLTNELALAFPKHAPALMQDKMREIRVFIWEHGDTILKDTSDLKFLNRVVGEFGQKADPLIRGYQECLEVGIITTDEKELVLEFARQLRVVAPATLAGYKEAKQLGHERIYIAQLKTLAERMTGSGTITESDRNKPYYRDILKHVYSNNSGQWNSFENNDSCADRSGDLADFTINPRYEIDLLSQSEIRIKAGETPNPSIQDEVQKPIIGVAEKMNALGHDKEKINLALNEDINKTLKEITENGGLQGIDPTTLTSTEEKMFLILTDSIYGTGSIDPKRVKDLITTYEFATFEDISDYMAGTRDRVSRANNQDYALLCEVGAFYSDRIKEVNRRLIETAYKNPQIATLMPEYFRKLSQDSSATQKQDRINRLQIDRLGASESFVKQLSRILEKRRGRKYAPEKVEEIIRRYEGMTVGLQEKASTSKNPQTRAFYGQLRNQRERSFEALQVITGKKVDPQKVHLGEVNLQQVLDTETEIKEGKYNEEQFASYTAQRFIDIFEDERIKIEGELSKFESISGKQREVLYGYITKSKESANARMVGGVCVAGDNPSKNKDRNMWDMPNYFQLVFQELDTLQCQGLVLLHNFTQDGKRILTASINPSSTYLYSVDETALFNGIMGTLEQFAKDNNFDMITFSQNKTIRTNRTGGQFEKSMDARVISVGKKFKFNSPQTFSYNPNYQLQEMDVVWEKS